MRCLVVLLLLVAVVASAFDSVVQIYEIIVRSLM